MWFLAVVSFVLRFAVLLLSCVCVNVIVWLCIHMCVCSVGPVGVCCVAIDDELEGSVFGGFLDGFVRCFQNGTGVRTHAHTNSVALVARTRTARLGTHT